MCLIICTFYKKTLDFLVHIVYYNTCKEDIAIQTTGGNKMKKYRVNASEYTNLCSMYDRLNGKYFQELEKLRKSANY